MAKVIGKKFYKSKKGEIVTTLYLAEDFPAYAAGDGKEKGCCGMQVLSVYAGAYDCSNIKPGMNVDILYGAVVTLSDGKTFQPVKKIDLLKDN